MSPRNTPIMIMTSFAVILAFFAQLLLALPFTKRDVWDPPVTNPVAGAVWDVGDSYLVTWDTSNPPPEVTDSTGMIVLRSGNLAIEPITLASDFSLYLGAYPVQVPDVPAAEDYVIDLFGDSGNWSPDFTIRVAP